MKTQTLLARINEEYFPYTGEYTLVMIEARGTEAGYLRVERGHTSKEDIELIKDDFHFVRLVPNGDVYRIDKIVPILDHKLRGTLLGIKNEFKRGSGGEDH